MTKLPGRKLCRLSEERGAGNDQLPVELVGPELAILFVGLKPTAGLPLG